MSPSTLGVVVAAWNRLDLTRACLMSLMAVELPLRIVVVDDGSTDGTTEAVRAAFPGVQVVQHRRNRGVTAAWNTGLRSLDTERVCILNNDLTVEPGCLEKLLDALRNPWIGVASPETHMEPGEVLPDFMEPSRAAPGSDETGALRVGFAGWCFVFRRKDFLEGFDPRFRLWYQDKDFLYTLLFRRRGIPPFRWPVPGMVPVVVPGARVRHAYHGSHGALDPDWVARRTDLEKRRFNRKWRGYRGNRWEREIRWGRRVHPTPPAARIVAQGSAAGFEERTRSPADDLVSVVIPAFEKVELLAETLASVIHQEYRPLEILVVDDGSTADLEPAVASALDSFDGDWCLLRLMRNAGPGIARRRGVEASSGSYFQFLDADDLLHPEKLACQVRLMEERPELLMTYARTHTFEHDPTDSELLGRTDQSFDRILPAIFRRMVWTTSSCLWRRTEDWDADDWAPLYAAEDVLFDFRAGLANRPIARTPGKEPLVWKRRHSESISAGIMQDLAYQQEILKSYDLMAQSLVSSEIDEKLAASWRAELAGLFDRKVMTFLVHRRYWEALHCIRKSASIDASQTSLDARIAELPSRHLGFLPLALLRRWRWLRRLGLGALVSAGNGDRSG